MVFPRGVCLEVATVIVAPSALPVKCYHRERSSYLVPLPLLLWSPAVCLAPVQFHYWLVRPTTPVPRSCGGVVRTSGACDGLLRALESHAAIALPHTSCTLYSCEVLSCVECVRCVFSSCSFLHSFLFVEGVSLGWGGRLRLEGTPLPLLGCMWLVSCWYLVQHV